MVPSASIPAVRQNRSKLTETASQALSTAPMPVGGKVVNDVITFFMALLSFRGISTPSLPAQGEQRRSSYFNIPRGNSVEAREAAVSLLKPEPNFHISEWTAGRWRSEKYVDGLRKAGLPE